MTVDQIIKESLNGITENIWPLYCPEDTAPDKYIIYNSELDVPNSYSDDSEEQWIHYMQIHLYTKGDYAEDRKIIRASLKAAGFTMTGIKTSYDMETRYTHLCFLCHIEEEES